jgi:DNA-binding NarL/FixJ family response regulator
MAPAAERPARVLIIDDHPMVREGLRSMLAGDGVTIVGEAASGAEALRRAAERDIDVVLLDLELPDMDGLVVLRRLRDADAKLPVLVVTMHEDPVLVRRAVEAGATGYVLKGIGRSELLASIHAVRSGESVFDPDLLKAAIAGADVEGDRSDRLSRVELDLLRLVAAGLTNRQIGQRLHWSHATVKKYVQRILEKLDVPDRTRAAVEAVRRGLLD